MDKVVSPDRTAIKVNEGSEPAEFWALLGGKGPYTTDENVMDTPTLSPRLFHCCIVPPSTELIVDEVFNFDQDVILNSIYNYPIYWILIDSFLCHRI